MPQPLDPMRGLYGAQPVQPAAVPAQKPQTTEDGKTFQDVLTDFVKQVDQSQVDYDAAIRAVERGETDNLHRVMLAQSQAQLSLKLAVEVRNKLVEAYKEVNRTQF
ncbi:MAG TPA: flagellar hook-basal body complex protein FliE [Planctomycetes bacterium]|nr:flagellar hook-basal body complex protein FliE [Planctomycetota bacterium]